MVRRNAGEENDRKAIKGDYYLSDSETENLKKVANAFRHTIVVLNTCVMDANFTNEIKGIDDVVYLGLADMEAGNALTDVLLGKVTPIGKLTDTWAKQYRDYPASETFSSNDGITLQEDYTEDIYVGYRWFDSMGIKPLYHRFPTTYMMELQCRLERDSTQDRMISRTSAGCEYAEFVI